MSMLMSATRVHNAEIDECKMVATNLEIHLLFSIAFSFDVFISLYVLMLCDRTSLCTICSIARRKETATKRYNNPHEWLLLTRNIDRIKRTTEVQEMAKHQLLVRCWSTHGWQRYLATYSKLWRQQFFKLKLFLSTAAYALYQLSRLLWNPTRSKVFSLAKHAVSSLLLSCREWIHGRKLWSKPGANHWCCWQCLVKKCRIKQNLEFQALIQFLSWN